MGAVADTSHSVYSGLIRVRRGAVKSDAMQTNHNLVLDEGAHADSVPNLDIEENDVKCSHGSTVGPVDEDQRYYLESRGIEPERAEQLIVAGFFDCIADQVPLPGSATWSVGPWPSVRGSPVAEADRGRCAGRRHGPTCAVGRPRPRRGAPLRRGRAAGGPRAHRRRVPRRRRPLQPRGLLAGRRRGVARRVRDRVRQARVDVRPPHRRAVLAAGHPAGTRLRGRRRRATTCRWWSREHRRAGHRGPAGRDPRPRDPRRGCPSPSAAARSTPSWVPTARARARWPTC